MTDGGQFEEATDTVVEFLSTLGEEVSPYDIDEEGDNTGRRRIIYVSEEVGPSYIVLASEGEEVFWLQAQYQLWTDVADELTETDINEYAPETIENSHPAHSVVPEFEKLDEPKQHQFAAAIEILDSLPSESRRDLILQLTEVFTRAGLKHSVGAVQEGSGITGFTVLHRLFPYEDEFSLTRLNDTVERVRMAAHMGELLLKYTFQLPVDIAESESGDVTNPGELPTRRAHTVDTGEIGDSLTEPNSENSE